MKFGLVLCGMMVLAACSAPTDRQVGDDGRIPAGSTGQIASQAQSASDSADRIEQQELLLPIRTEDIQAAELDGDRMCAFTNLKGHTLLITRVDTGSQARSAGLARTGDGPILLMGIGRGGFGALETRAALSGEEANIWVETQGEPLPDRSEAETRNASLRFASGADEPEPVPGTWTCGP